MPIPTVQTNDHAIWYAKPGASQPERRLALVLVGGPTTPGRVRVTPVKVLHDDASVLNQRGELNVELAKLRKLDESERAEFGIETKAEKREREATELRARRVEKYGEAAVQHFEAHGEYPKPGEPLDLPEPEEVED